MMLIFNLLTLTIIEFMTWPIRTLSFHIFFSCNSPFRIVKSHRFDLFNNSIFFKYWSTWTNLFSFWKILLCITMKHNLSFCYLLYYTIFVILTWIVLSIYFWFYWSTIFFFKFILYIIASYNMHLWNKHQLTVW